MIKFNYFLLIFLSVFIVNPGFSQQQLTAEQKEEKNIVPGEILVRMHKGQDPESILRELPSNYGLKIDRILSKYSDIWLLKYDPSKIQHNELVSEILRVKEVWLAQVNHKVELRAAPNDPNYSNQWQHQNIDSELAWDITTGGTTATGDDIVVCVIESADVMGHPDLQNNHWVNTAEIPNNGIDDDNNGYVDDYDGWNVGTNNDNIGTGSHGTAVAGMIGAQGNNNQGVAGANWDVKIMVVAGYNNPFTEANIVEAYTYPLEARLLWNQTNGAQGSFVVSTNASWGVDGGDPNNYPIWCSFYDDLGQVGILNCGATTNQSQDVDTFGDVPTACASDYMVAVTATDINDQITFAGYGDQTIDVGAPGDNIYSTSANGGYSNTSGTSFASPLTAGVIGLMYSIPCPNLISMALADPQGTADIVRTALYNGVDQSLHLQQRTVTGGRINAKNSIDLLMTQVCSTCTPPGNVSTDIINDTDATISFDAVADANNYIIYIQEAGSGNWTSTTTTNLTHTFTGLLPCTSYEYYIESDCGTEVSIPSQTVSFNTTGCGNCIDLNYCLTGTNPNPAVTLTVHTPSNVAGSYFYEETNGWGGDVSTGYVYGEVVLVDDGTANGDEGCNALINGAAINGNIAIAMRGSCNFTTKALNAQNAGATAIIVVNNQAGAPIVMGGTDPNVTIPAVMISLADGTALINEINGGATVTALLGAQNEWIESFELNGNLTVSGDDGGYRAPDLTPFQLNLGQAYSFTMTPGFDGQPILEYTRIWLDADQSGTFDAGEMIYDQGNASFGALTDNLLIPANALPGSTRLRVQMAYQGYGADPLPGVCGNFTSGEVEDYCVELTSNQICNMDVVSTITQPACATVTDGEIEVFVSGGTPGYTYTWSNGAGNTNINSNLDAGNYILTVTDNAACDTSISYTLSYSTNLLMNSTVNQPTCSMNDDGSITAFATGGTGISYQWTNGPSTALYDNLGAGTFEVTATAGNGCFITESYTLNYTTNIVLDSTITHPTCNDTQDGEITVTASGSTGFQYQWTGGPATQTWSGIGNGTYQVTVTDQDGCVATEDFTLNANPTVPAAGFNSAPSFLTVDFFNLSTGANSFSWDFGDGNTSTDFNPTHTYAANGTYNVCLTAYSDCDESTVCNDVTVNENDASLSSEDLNELISVYPNPAKEYLNFVVKIEEAQSIELYDATGKKVISGDILNDKTVIELSRFNSGLYFYHIKDKNGNTLYSDKVSVIK
ncbi:MAG: S8 family serine peptidase [Brumimicrobium sp.]|nr:S8 family serine peptidase [Brumimicrobium sp.]